MDAFTPRRMRGKGKVVYQCIAHALWGDYFDSLRLEVEYAPEPIQYGWPGTERYKVGSKTRMIVYGPVFSVSGVGFVDIAVRVPERLIADDAFGDTVQMAERYSREHGGEVIYVIGGIPKVPCTWKRPVNEVVTVRQGEPCKFGCRLQHNGRKFFIARGEDHVYAGALLEASARAETLADILIGPTNLKL